MRRFDKKKQIEKVNQLFEQRHLIRKGLIKEDTGGVPTRGFNFIYSRNDSPYITEDIIDEQISSVVGQHPYTYMRIRIGLNGYRGSQVMDPSEQVNMASKLYFIHSTKEGSQPKLLFNYNFTGEENLFEVIEPQFHAPFKRLLERLTEYAEGKIQERLQSKQR